MGAPDLLAPAQEGPVRAGRRTLDPSRDPGLDAGGTEAHPDA
jgi:hypothetical protein